MSRNVVIAVVLGFAVLVFRDATRHPKAPLASPAAAQPVRTAEGQPAPPPAPASALDPPAPPETPVLDMLARLATRRRIAREGNQVYLDSLFAHTDSAITRWSERDTLIVQLVPDTLLRQWTPALLDEARAGMHAWDHGGSGTVMREAAPNDAVDVTVHWVDVLPDSGQVGVTTLRWTPDGVAHSATITLALRRNTDSGVVSPATRARVAVHEFGHALGLPHSDRSDDIMFQNSPVPAPSARDLATLRLLYALFPGPLRVQP